MPDTIHSGGSFLIRKYIVCFSSSFIFCNGLKFPLIGTATKSISFLQLQLYEYVYTSTKFTILTNLNIPHPSRVLLFYIHIIQINARSCMGVIFVINIKIIFLNDFGVFRVSSGIFAKCWKQVLSPVRLSTLSSGEYRPSFHCIRALRWPFRCIFWLNSGTSLPA